MCATSSVAPAAVGTPDAASRSAGGELPPSCVGSCDTSAPHAALTALAAHSSRCLALRSPASRGRAEEVSSGSVHLSLPHTHTHTHTPTHALAHLRRLSNPRSLGRLATDIWHIRAGVRWEIQQLGPLRDAANAEAIGCISSAGLVAILACCLAMYGAVSFQTEAPLATKTLSGRETTADALQTSEG